ncbi:hypothetical protein MTR67_044509 [Solanum verrucosum]|uniref:Uncharacterized protein n=1 Tax=Solanum verrucosum TaxID=315347 RepID=A0AAF0ZW54_SOLVR|nr:hypothetical protein MTR67_044509 [Solanum verrucosum]
MCEGDKLKNQVEAFEEMISEVPFQYRAGESIILILNRSTEVEISQEQPPGFSKILLRADHEKQNIRGFTFWFDTCKIGSFAEKVMEAYKIGKKHKRNEENKSCNVGLSPMKPQFIQLVEYPSDDMISGKKSEEGSSGTSDNDQP